MPGTAVGCSARVRAHSQAGARQVGQENALLIVFEVCKAKRGSALISHRRRVAGNLRTHTHTTGRQELQISPWSLLPFIFFISPSSFPISPTLPKETILSLFVFTSTLWKKRKRRQWLEKQKGHYGSSGNCRTIENKQGNLLPINSIFAWFSYHPNWIFMPNDAACVGTGGIIAKHARVRYANGAHFPTNLKWLSLYHSHTKT